jgi:hypothetical protein
MALGSRGVSLCACELRHITLPRIDLQSISSLDCDPSPMAGPFLRSARPPPRRRTRPSAGPDCPAHEQPASRTRTSALPRVTERPSRAMQSALPGHAIEHDENVGLVSQFEILPSLSSAD